MKWIRYLLVVAAAVGMTFICSAKSPSVSEEQWTVYFAHDSYRLQLGDNGRDEPNKLDEAALQMKQDPDVRAQITGYSQPDEKDQRGMYSGPVAELRAQAVKNYLVTRQGIDPARMAIAGEKSSTREPSAVITLVQQ